MPLLLARAVLVRQLPLLVEGLRLARDALLPARLAVLDDLPQRLVHRLGHGRRAEGHLQLRVRVSCLSDIVRVVANG